MTDKIDKSRLAAVQFFRTANPQDEFFLVNFNDRAQLVSPFTASVDDLAEPPDVHGRARHDGALRRRLSRTEPDEGEHTTRRKLCSSYRTGAIIIVGTAKPTSASSCGKRTFRFTPSASFEPDGGPTPEERGRPFASGRSHRDDGRQDFTVQNLNELPDIAIENQHGVAQSVCLRIPAEQPGTRWQVAQNQSQAPSAQGSSSAHRVREERILRSGPLAALRFRVLRIALACDFSGVPLRLTRRIHPPILAPATPPPPPPPPKAAGQQAPSNGSGGIRPRGATRNRRRRSRSIRPRPERGKFPDLRAQDRTEDFRLLAATTFP